MSMKAESEVKEYKEYLEDMIIHMNKRTDADTFSIKSTVLTLEDEIEVLKCVLNEKCSPVGGTI